MSELEYFNHEMLCIVFIFYASKNKQYGKHIVSLTVKYTFK